MDLTGDIAEAMGATLVRHDRNMGYGASLRSLFSEALGLGADVVVTLDGDMESIINCRGIWSGGYVRD